MVRYTWRNTLLMTHGWLLHMEDLLMTWSFDWWRLGALVDGGLAWMMLWLMEAWLGWCLGWWRFWYVDDLGQFLFYTLPTSWSLPPLRVGFLKPLLVGSKRTLAGSSRRVGTLISVGAEWSEKIEVFCITTTIVSNGFYQWIMIEFSIYIWCTLSTWFIHCYALKINKCGICFIRTGCKKLLGKVRKIGLSVHTLIHPPS